MAGATGLEPATSGVTGRHSNQLSYAPAGVRAFSKRWGELREGRRLVKEPRRREMSPRPFDWSTGTAGTL